MERGLTLLSIITIIIGISLVVALVTVLYKTKESEQASTFELLRVCDLFFFSISSRLLSHDDILN